MNQIGSITNGVNTSRSRKRGTAQAIHLVTAMMRCQGVSDEEPSARSPGWRVAWPQARTFSLPDGATTRSLD